MTYDETSAESGKAAPLRGLVPMIHVADVERSLEFYRLLGFEVGNKTPPKGRLNWAWLYSPEAADWRRGPNLMLARSPHAIHAGAQEALFYVYVADLPSLRQELIKSGLKAGEIRYPDYLPGGEFQMQDPDGYCLMIAQSAPDTP